MWKKIVAMALVLVVLPSIAACAGFPPAQEVVDGAIESFDNIKTYQFELDMTMHTTGEIEGEATEHTVTMDNSGTLDLENQQMKADMSAGSGDEMMRVEMYIIDGMVYARPEAPGEDPVWMKSEAPAEYWEMMKGASGIENYKELLDTTQVKVIGGEKVKGVDCYVLQLTPELAELYQAAMDPVGGIGQAGMLAPVPEELLQDMFQSFSVKIWISKDTYFLMKAEIDMNIESTPELMDYLGEEVEVSIDINIVFLAYNYNQPVTIVVPPEAEEATAVQEEMGAAGKELDMVQAAVISMMIDNELSELPNPITVPTDDMTAFPDNSACGIDKITDWYGNTYIAGKDKDGYLLYQHDLVADSKSTDLVNYVATQYTKGTYTVDKYGTVTQVTFSLE